MIRCGLVGKIAGIDFHGYVRVALPLSSTRVSGDIALEESRIYCFVSLPNHTVEELPHPGFAIISYLSLKISPGCTG